MITQCKLDQFVKVVDPIWYLPLLVTAVLWFVGYKYSKKYFRVIGYIIAFLDLLVLYLGCALLSGLS